MSTIFISNDDETPDDVYSVEWITTYLEKNPVWLFNNELLSKIVKATEDHVCLHSIVWPTIKTRQRYNTGVDFKETEWYKLLHNPLISVPDSYIARQFQRRYRLPYGLFLKLVEDVKEYNIFNLNNPYSKNLKIPIELKCMVSLRMLGRDLICDDVFEMSCIPLSTCNKIYRQFIKGFAEKLYSKYVYIPKDEEFLSILKMYDM